LENKKDDLRGTWNGNIFVEKQIIKIKYFLFLEIVINQNL